MEYYRVYRSQLSKRQNAQLDVPILELLCGSHPWQNDLLNLYALWVEEDGNHKMKVKVAMALVSFCCHSQGIYFSVHNAELAKRLIWKDLDAFGFHLP